MRILNRITATFRTILAAASTALLMVGLSGCAGYSTTDYRPIAGNEFGYSERRIKENSYEVSFKGHKRTTQEEANDFALLRGLEIASKLDYDYMLITSTKDNTSSRSSTAGVSCYPNVYGQQVCSGGGTYRSTFAGITIKVQFFDERPTGRYLPESLLAVDTTYAVLSKKYGLEVAEAEPPNVKEPSPKNNNPSLTVSMQKLYTPEELTEGGWDLRDCSVLPRSNYNVGNEDDVLSAWFVNDTDSGIYDAYVDLRGNISFLKSRNAGEKYKYSTYLGTNWVWFSDKGRCLGWATATERWPENTQRILELTDSE